MNGYPGAVLDIHAKAEPASRFGLHDLIDFEGWQYRVTTYDVQPDGTVKVRLEATGNEATGATGQRRSQS
jgi:hypothetical protein